MLSSSDNFITYAPLRPSESHDFLMLLATPQAGGKSVQPGNDGGSGVAISMGWVGCSNGGGVAMLDPVALIEACEHCYAYPMYTAGPNGRDAATITRIDGQTVLVFRGTVTEGAVAWLDWLNDLRAALVYQPGLPGLVHAGFADAVDNLLLILPRFNRAPAPVVIGHSKGGAMAQLFAMRLYNLFGLETKVVTFGAPRAGDDDFAAAANAALDIDRYENPHDIVPLLPPGDYRHAGYRITPPATWAPPRSIQEQHSLATGYRPWIEGNQQPPRRAA